MGVVVHEMRYIAAQYHWAVVRQSDEQRLMTRSVPGRRNDPNRAIVEDVIVFFQQQHRIRPHGPVQVRDKAVGMRFGVEHSVPFRPLDVKRSVGKEPGIADVIEMRDLCWSDSDLFELRRDSSRDNAPYAMLTLDSFGRGYQIIVKARIPDHPIIAVLNQIRIATEPAWLPDIQAGRPLRNVGNMRFTAVENIDTINRCRGFLLIVSHMGCSC